eukprot:scaffold1169_cov367-Prasinococcus_capsulatus_cf.AAC.6
MPARRAPSEPPPREGCCHMRPRRKAQLHPSSHLTARRLHADVALTGCESLHGKYKPCSVTPEPPACGWEESPTCGPGCGWLARGGARSRFCRRRARGRSRAGLASA